MVVCSHKQLILFFLYLLNYSVPFANFLAPYPVALSLCCYTLSRLLTRQVTLSSSYLGEESDVEVLSGVLGSLIAAQVSGKVVGEGADEVSSEYFRLSTGLYDTATVGTVQVREVGCCCGS